MGTWGPIPLSLWFLQTDSPRDFRQISQGITIPFSQWVWGQLVLQGDWAKVDRERKGKGEETGERLEVVREIRTEKRLLEMKAGWKRQARELEERRKGEGKIMEKK